MICIDSSVWIDYFCGVATAQTDRLDSWLADELVITGDLVLDEVLQGFDRDADARRALRPFAAVQTTEVSSIQIAREAARNFRILRGFGITIRKTVDTLIATRGIADGHALLFSDRDFDPFVQRLGLQTALALN